MGEGRLLGPYLLQAAVDVDDLHAHYQDQHGQYHDQHGIVPLFAWFLLLRHGLLPLSDGGRAVPFSLL